MPYDDNNIFAKILRGDAQANRVYEDEWTVAILDVMPQADGHALVLPKSRAENIFDLDPEMAAAVIRTTRKIAKAAHAAFHPDGITISQFNGAAAGQTVFHFHMHVIPRYVGQSLRGHGRGFADPDTLAEQTLRLRAALAELE